MPSDGNQRKQGRLWISAGVLLGGTALVLFVGVYLLDWWHVERIPGAPKLDPFAQLFSYDADTAQNALGNLAQVVAAVLGIVITVVSIVVQLAATRYTPRIADMFFRDRTNLLVLGFFVVAGIDAVWVSLSVTHDFVPRFSILASLLLVTTSILIMVPYFAYVFDFLDPEKIVARMQEQALAAAEDETGYLPLPQRQTRVLQAIEQLGDVAMNAIAQKDKLIAQGAVDSLKTLETSYLGRKRQMAPSWFEVGERLRQNPDFVSMSGESVDEIAAQRTWLEWKVLRQYQMVFNEALGQTSDMCHLVAIDTRYIGEAALSVGDTHTLALAIKFFNTYLRATLNADQVRTAYNILNQYRQLCERLLEAARSESDAARVVEVAGYFRYYGQVAQGKGLSFITETVAYDLASLCERAFATKAPSHEALLRVLLDVDREAETAENERALRGVRKAQAKLAAFYLASGAELDARRIFEDMKDEPAARLVSIRDELCAVSSKYFWEVIDRGTNFDYMDESRKQKLREFFGWFPSLQQGATSAAS